MIKREGVQECVREMRHGKWSMGVFYVRETIEESVRDCVKGLYLESSCEEIRLDTQKWIEFLLCFGEPAKIGEVSKIFRKEAGICGKTWNPGQVAFKCHTCEKDPTCAICQECFLNGNHEGHDYSMITTSSGMCDCGDLDSWDQKGFCKHHKGPDQDPTEHLHSFPHLRSCGMGLCLGIVQVIAILIAEYADLNKKNSTSSSNEKTLMQVHIKDLHTKCLIVLATIHKMISPSPSLKRLLCNAFEQKIKTNTTEVEAVHLLLSNSPFLSKTISERLYNVIASAISDAHFKKMFSISFAKNYKAIIMGEHSKRHDIHEENDDDDDDKCSLTSISVQIFTVPPLAELICSPEIGFFNQTLDCLTEISSEITKKHPKVRGRTILDLSSSVLESSSFFHFMHDYVYVLMHKSVSFQFIMQEQLFSRFLQFLSYIQACTEVYRIDSDDDEWSSSFTMEIRVLKIIRHLSESIILAKQNVTSNDNNSLLLEAAQIRTPLGVCLKEISKFLDCEKFMFTSVSTPIPKQIIDSNMYFGPIAYNLPLHRLLSSFLHEISKNWSFENLSLVMKINDKHLDQTFLLKLLENPLKLSVMKSHVKRRFWPRNNLHVIEQQLYYESSFFSDYSYMNDVFLVQVLSTQIERVSFFVTCMDRFKKGHENPNEALKRSLFCIENRGNNEVDEAYLGLEADFFRFILTLYTDRSYSGLDYDKTAKLFVLHSLFLKDEPFSALKSKVPKRFRIGNKLIGDILEECAQLQWQKGIQQKGCFSVKKEYWDYLNPYFINYSPRECQLSEEMAKRCAPKQFTISLHQPSKPYKSLRKLMGIIHHELLHRAIFIVLYRVLDEFKKDCNKIPNEPLFTTTLHLMIYILESLQDEEVQTLIMEEDTQNVPTSEQNITDCLSFNFPCTSNILTNMKYDINIGGKKENILGMLLKLSEYKETKEWNHLFNRIFDRVALLDKQCNHMIKQFLDESDEKTKDANKEDEKKMKLQKAKLRQQMLMKKMMMQQKSLDENQFLEEEDDVLSPIVENEQKITCAFCHEAISPGGLQELSLFAHITSSNVLQTIAEQNYADYKIKEKILLEDDISGKLKRFSDFPNTELIQMPKNIRHLFSSIDIGEKAQMRSCGHACHSDCFDSYFMSLTKLRLFKGYQYCDLENREALCPLCGRMTNTLCPIISTTMNTSNILEYCKAPPSSSSTSPTISLNYTNSVPDPEIILELIQTPKQQSTSLSDVNNQTSTNYSLSSSLQLFSDRILACSTFPHRFHITDSSDPCLLFSTVAYNIGTLESAERLTGWSLSSIEQKEKDNLRNLIQTSYISSIHHQKNAILASKQLDVMISLLRGETKQSTSQVLRRAPKVKNFSDMGLIERLLVHLSSNQENEDKDDQSDSDEEMEEKQNSNKDGVIKESDSEGIPFLSCDLFSLLVKLVFLKPELLYPNNFISISRIFYTGHILQCLLALHYRYLCGSSKYMVKSLNSSETIIKISNKLLTPFFTSIEAFIPEKEQSPKVNISDCDQFAKELSLTFLRRLALFTSICYKRHIPNIENYEEQHSVLSNYLKLSKFEEVLTEIVNDKSKYNLIVQKWMQQLGQHISVQNDKQIVNNLIPRMAPVRAFHFIRLPKLYQPLFLKYHKYECSQCKTLINNPMICLITGESVCPCKAPPHLVNSSLVDICSKYARKNLCGVGLFLILKHSTILLVRENRYTELPSPYLDQFGEEDTKLRRGVALNLQETRYTAYLRPYILNDFDQDTILLGHTRGAHIVTL